jgi:hypothetical protein
LQSVPCDYCVGGTEPAIYPVYSNYRSSIHNEHEVCFHLPDVKMDPLRLAISMDQPSVAMYLSLEGLNAVEIHNDLVAALKDEAKSYITVTYYHRKPSFSGPRTTQPSESPPPILSESDETILMALSEEPFASVRQLARKTHLHSSTVYIHPAHKLGFTDIFVGSHIFCRKLTSTPQHNFHLNSSRCFSPRKTGRGMTL